MVNSTQLTQAYQKHLGVANLSFHRPWSDQLLLCLKKIAGCEGHGGIAFALNFNLFMKK